MSETEFDYSGLIGGIFSLCTAFIALFAIIYFYSRRRQYRKANKAMIYFIIVLVISIVLATVPFLYKENLLNGIQLKWIDIGLPLINILLLYIGFKRNYGRKASKTERLRNT
jgi:cell division protein FtsW (lipid II flippase)